MPEDLKTLLAAAKESTPTAAEHEVQRRSFAYGNTHFENERITKEMVNCAAEALKAADEKNGRSTR